MSESMTVVFSRRGSHTVSIGDEFFTPFGRHPGTYRVECFGGIERYADRDGRIPDPNGEYQSVTSYSPAGLGGTPTIGCRNVSTGEARDFCGDSVASALANPMEKPADWNEAEAIERNRKLYEFGV